MAKMRPSNITTISFLLSKSICIKVSAEHKRMEVNHVYYHISTNTRCISTKIVTRNTTLERFLVFRDLCSSLYLETLHKLLKFMEGRDQLLEFFHSTSQLFDGLACLQDWTTFYKSLNTRNRSDIVLRVAVMVGMQILMSIEKSLIRKILHDWQNNETTNTH